MIIYKYLDPDGAVKTVEDNSVLLRTPDEYNDPSDCLFDSNDKERNKALRLFINYQFFKCLYVELVVNNKTLVFGKEYTENVKKTIICLANNIKKTKKYKWQPDIAMYYRIAKMINKKNGHEECNIDENKMKIIFDKVFDDVFQKIKTSILICCFSLRNDSILMWSHYAKNHTGACVEFEVDDNDFRKVRYAKNLIIFN